MSVPVLQSSRRCTLPGASGASVISTRRQRVPSASSRIVAVTGTFSGVPVRPSSRAATCRAERRGRLDDSRSVRRNRKICRRDFSRTDPPEEQRAGAERRGVERKDDRLGRSERGHTLRANQAPCNRRLERRRRRDRDLRDERSRAPALRSLSQSAYLRSSSASPPPARPCSNRRPSPCCAALRRRRERSRHVPMSTPPTPARATATLAKTRPATTAPARASATSPCRPTSSPSSASRPRPPSPRDIRPARAPARRGVSRER